MLAKTIFVCVTILMNLGCVQSQDGDEANVDCPTGFFEQGCNQTCHCLNGPEMCDSVYGCTDYQCDRGWGGPPACQQECDSTHFGPNCEGECHCVPGELCNIINGVCPSGRCHVEWTGASCQTRLPKLTRPPQVNNVTCHEMNVSWSAWSNENDIGDNSIGGYVLQESRNRSEYIDIRTIAFIPDRQEYFIFFQNQDPWIYYSFRVVANMLRYGRIKRGLPSPPSDSYKASCYVPTTTTTTTTTTTVPTTTTITTTITTTTEPTTTTVPTTTTTPTTTTRTPEPLPPSASRDVFIDISNTGVITLTWSAPDNVDGGVLGYNVTYWKLFTGDCEEDVGEPVTTQLAASADSFILQGLENWSQYQVEISAINFVGIGDTVTRTFTTPEILPVGKVQNVGHSTVSESSITFTWQPVPCSLRGGVLLFHEVTVQETESGTPVFSDVVGKSKTSILVSSLTPNTQYGIKISYVNNKGPGPYSDLYNVRTNQDVPPAPRNFRVINSTESTIFVIWSAPTPANGLLLQYRITYSIVGQEGEFSTIIKATDDRYKQLDSLAPYTRYSLKIQAQTGAATNNGWGSFSNSIEYNTTDGSPSGPLDAERLFRNKSCITIRWKVPANPNGQLQNYRVKYRAIAVKSIGNIEVIDKIVELPTTQLELVLCSLQPAAQYRFIIQASSRKGYGEEAYFIAWTEVGTPGVPPRPVVVSTTLSSITVRLQNIALREGPVSGYFVVVERIVDLAGERKKRSFHKLRIRRATLPDPVSFIPLSGYTTASISPADLTEPQTFLIGNDQDWGGYTNKILEQNEVYNVYFVVASSVDGVTKMSFSQIKTPVKTIDSDAIVTPTLTLQPRPTTTTATTFTTTTASTTTTTTTTPSTPESTPSVTIPALVDDQTTEAPAEDNTMLIIIIVCVIIGVLLIIAIIIIIICILKRRSNRQYETKDTTWLNTYVANFGEETKPRPQHDKWSDIYTIDENRYPIVDPKYLPEDLKVADMHHTTPKISFDEEYKKLPQGKTYEWKAALKPHNFDRNRFDHILAYDHSRVVLRHKHGSDYINANYIQGYNKQNAYIACQSPFNEITMADMWYMAYIMDVAQIVFLARLMEDGIVKSERYWPTTGIQQYGEIMVKHVQTETFANFVVRGFDLQLGAQPIKRVTQYQFTQWPDHGVPPDPIPFLEFRRKVKTNALRGDGPILLHCGTGVSRSAVFAAVDSLLEQAKVENAVNVFKFCKTMRQSRIMMVRTLKQYKFIYDALFEALITNYNIVGEDLKISYRQLSRISPLTDKSYFREQFEVLERYAPSLDPEKCQVALREVNQKKNRFRTLVPPDAYRVVLQSPGMQGSTDYINALYLDSYQEKNGFIMTQTPLLDTVVDFWRMVYDFDVSTIVMLNDSEFHEDTCATYWPNRRGQQKYDKYFVTLVDEIEEEHVTIRLMNITNSAEANSKTRKLKMFQFESWRMYEKVPWSREGFIQMQELVDDWLDESEQDGPVVVHCMDGASQSGLFVAAYIICEKMRWEGEVDVFHTIKHMKRRRKHFVNSLEQYKFCFKLLWDYMNTRLDQHDPPSPDEQFQDDEQTFDDREALYSLAKQLE